VSVRRGYHLLPKHIFGKPTDVFASDGPQLPLWLEGPIFSFLLRLIMGDLQKLGMPKPDHGLLETHPIMNDQLVHHLRHGDIAINGDIESLEGPTVVFTDGTRQDFDLILLATGYTRRIPYLDSKYLDPGQWAAAQFLTCFSRKYESLYTLGFAELNGALYPTLSRLAVLIAELEQARERAPERRARFFDWVRSAKLDLSGGRKLVASPRHAHYCDEHALTRAIRQAFEIFGGPEPKQLTVAPPRLPAPQTE
jgi:hypothetical protein